MADPTRHKEGGSVKRLLPALVALLLAMTLWSPATAADEGMAGIDVRLWQDTTNGKRLHLSARPAEGSWRTLGTVELLVDEAGSTDALRLYQTVRIAAPLPGSDSGGGTAAVEIRVELPLDGPGAPVVVARGRGISGPRRCRRPSCSTRSRATAGSATATSSWRFRSRIPAAGTST